MVRTIQEEERLMEHGCHSRSTYGVHGNSYGPSTTRLSMDRPRKVETKVVEKEPKSCSVNYTPSETSWHQAIATLSFSSPSTATFKDQPTPSWIGLICTIPSPTTVSKKQTDRQYVVFVPYVHTSLRNRPKSRSVWNYTSVCRLLGSNSPP